MSEAQRPKVVAIPNDKREKTRAFCAKGDDGNQATARGCLFCERSDHKAIDCDKVVSVEQRKNIFLDKRLCFNYMRSRHRAQDCRSTSTCQNYHSRHHTSLYDRVQAREPGMATYKIGNTASETLLIGVRMDDDDTKDRLPVTSYWARMILRRLALESV